MDLRFLDFPNLRKAHFTESHNIYHLYSAATEIQIPYLAMVFWTTNKGGLRRSIKTRFIDCTHSLDHCRNVGFVTLFYRFYYERFSNEISDFITGIWIFALNTSLSRKSHKFVIFGY